MVEREQELVMGRQEIVDHIERELKQELDGDTEEAESSPILCRQCGIQIASETGSVPPDHGEYVVHRVPDPRGSDHQSVFYCGQSCFTEAMDALLSP